MFNLNVKRIAANIRRSPHILTFSENRFRIVKIKSFISGELRNSGNEWPAFPADFTNIKISGEIVLSLEFTSVFGHSVYFSRFDGISLSLSLYTAIATRGFTV